MYNLCCKSGKATKLFFRKNIPEAVAGLLEEMRKAQDETYYHPQVSICRWSLHWSQETMTSLFSSFLSFVVGITFVDDEAVVVGDNVALGLFRTIWT